MVTVDIKKVSETEITDYVIRLGNGNIRILLAVPPLEFQKVGVTYVQNGAHFARRRVAQVRASEALRLLGRGGGSAGRPPN